MKLFGGIQYVANKPPKKVNGIKLWDADTGQAVANINTNSVISSVQNNVNIDGISNVSINDIGNWCGNHINNINIGNSVKLKNSQEISETVFNKFINITKNFYNFYTFFKDFSICQVFASLLHKIIFACI